MILANISKAMLIKETIVLFTSAVRSEGGFFKASLKEVSMAPVIFITSAQIHLFHFLFRYPHFHVSRLRFQPNKLTSPVDLVLAEPSMDGFFTPKTTRSSFLSRREGKTSLSAYCASEKK